MGVRAIAGAGTAALWLFALPAPSAALAAGSAVALRGGALTVTIGPAAVSALTASPLGVFTQTRTMTAVAPATAPALGRLRFPLSGGSVNVAKLTGTVYSRGGISFRSRIDALGVTTTTSFVLEGFVLELGGARPMLTVKYAGGSTSPNTPLATPVLAKATHSLRGHTVSISKIGLRLTRVGAQVLNQQAGGSTFAAGQQLGSASVAATT